MISLKVEYTVKPEFVETNKNNIKKVMADLRELNNSGIRYSAYIKEDGISFLHFAMYPDEATKNIVEELPSFNFFRKSLKESEPVNPPMSETFEMIAAAYDPFK